LRKYTSRAGNQRVFSLAEKTFACSANKNHSGMLIWFAAENYNYSIGKVVNQVEFVKENYLVLE